MIGERIMLMEASWWLIQLHFSWFVFLCLMCVFIGLAEWL